MSRKPDEWMPLHIGDYHADTTHLTREQHGAYVLLLMAYWRRGGPLPDDDARLAAIVKASAGEWRRLKPILTEFFEVLDGQWRQKRADKELAKANAMTNAKAEAGRKGAERRWHNDTPANGTAMAEPSSCHRQTDAPIPLPSPIQSFLRNDIGASQAKAVSPKRERRVLSDLPDDCPSQTDREAAAGYWRDRGREDLCARLGDEADAFRDHHRSRASRMADWPATWRTWYRNAVKFNAMARPPQSSGLPQAKILKVVGE